MENSYLLDEKELDFEPQGSTKRKLNDVFKVLSEELRISRKEQLSIFNHFFLQGAQPKWLLSQVKKYNYTEQKNELVRLKKLNQCVTTIAAISPLDLLCSCYIFKANGTSSSKKLTESTRRANDITVENGMVFGEFVEKISPEDEAVVIYPSPFFVRKWMSDKRLRNIKTYFVFQSKDEQSLLEYHYTEGSYSSEGIGNATFMDEEKWKDKAPELGGRLQILVFSNHEYGDILKLKWLELLPKSNKYGFVLFTSTQESSGSFLPFSILRKHLISIERVYLLPQGIKNSSCPRRKMMIEGTGNPVTFSDYPVAVSGYRLDTTRSADCQSMTIIDTEPVMIDRQSYDCLNTSVRKYYHDELIERS